MNLRAFIAEISHAEFVLISNFSFAVYNLFDFYHRRKRSDLMASEHVDCVFAVKTG